MFKKSPMYFLTAMLAALMILSACAPAATAQLPASTQPVATKNPQLITPDSVTCLDSEAVEVRGEGLRFGFVPLLSGPVNDGDYYSLLLKESGHFKRTVYAPELLSSGDNGIIPLRKHDGELIIVYPGTSVDFNGNISVKNVEDRLVIVKDGKEEICVPETRILTVNGFFNSWYQSRASAAVHSCGSGATTGDRILIKFYDALKLLKKEEGGFRVVNVDSWRSAVSSYSVSAEGDFRFYAMRYDNGKIYQTDVTACFGSDTIGAELYDYPIEQGTWIYTRDEFYSFEVVDSTVCNSNDADLIKFYWYPNSSEKTSTFVEYSLDEQTGNLTVNLLRVVGPSSSIVNELIFVDSLPPGKAVLIKYKDREGNVQEFPLVVDCTTFISWIYK